MDLMSEIDSRLRMQRIVGRLPMYLQTRWRRDAVEHMERSGAYPNIEALAKYLERAARVANDPVFGIQDGNQGSVKSIDSGNKGAHPAQKKRGHGGAAFNVQVDQAGTKHERQNKPTCRHCKESHKTSTCGKWQKLTPAKRLEVVKTNRLCYNCVDYSNHNSRWCRAPRDCNVGGCSRKHSKFLHEALEEEFKNRPPVSTSDDKQADVTSYACHEKTQYAKRTIALPIVPVKVRIPGRNQYVHTLALLDTGSNKSFCSTKLTDCLEAKGNELTMSMQTLTAESKVKATEFSLEVSATGSIGKRARIVNLPKVCAIPDFPPFDASMPPSTAVQAWNHLKDLKLPKLHDGAVLLLIGQDAPDALMPLEVRPGESGEPYAMRTILGWSLNGPFDALSSSASEAVCNFIHTADHHEKVLESKVENFWKIDTEFALAATETQMSVDDRTAMDIWNESIKRVDGHYEMKIPFKPDADMLPDNKKMAVARLNHLKRKLRNNPDMHERYTEGMTDLIAKGHGERCEVEVSQGQRTWYLPHHGVTSPNKPDKLRIVFDCAARYAGTSLNENVLQGPDMMNKLLGVLLRFREGQVAVMADIEAMFHQVKVMTTSDRDVLRFLWWEDGKLDATPVIYRMTVHLFGGVWCPSCAQFALKQTALDNAHSCSSATTTAVHENFYVDDCLKSFDDEQNANKTVKELVDVLALGGFRLTKWVSNRRGVLDNIEESERAKEIRSLDLNKSELPQQRALGISWDPEKDNLGINVKQQSGQFTRRGLLSIMSTVYDPLGLVGPFVPQAKLIFQAECRLTKGWDEQLEDEHKSRWCVWLDQLQHLGDVKLSRSLRPKPTSNATVELHHFCDASQLAYGTVTYMRIQYSTTEVHCSFVLAKTKLAPLKQMTVPRLELSAAILGVRVSNMLKRELRTEIDRCVFWTDSQIVLQYIKTTTKRFHTFVANRVALIHDGSSPDEWRYVNTELNPADDASRGLNAGQLAASSRWLQGPEFLLKNEDEWPGNPCSVPDHLSCDKEVKREVTSHNVVTITDEEATDKLLRYHSSWYRLKRAVAWLLRYKKWLQKIHDVKGRLQLTEIQSAEEQIILYAQRRAYHKELQSLKSTRGTLHRSSSIYKLEPYRDTAGILRVKGRLTRASHLEETSKHPVILPKDSPLSEVIVRETHEITGHSGREHVLGTVRKKYWIVKPRSLIDRVLRECFTCKRLYAQPIVQRMADLVEERVVPGDPPFSFVGVDCFGPFLVKRGRSEEKRYGCIFTCLSMRALHLEKLPYMDTSAFVNALVRFIARRGCPKRIRSDNGTNFVGATRDLRNALKQINEDPILRNLCHQRNIEWAFNPPAASHMGGAWERQIRAARKTLLAILPHHPLDDDKLSTLFCEVEDIINGRPLTPISSDPNDLEALTPNHLLRLGPAPEGPPGMFRKEDVYGKRWRHVQHLADLFWKRWVKEYLPSIMVRQKWFQGRNIKQGDLVLVVEMMTPRKAWPLARVTRIHNGDDGLVRSVEVKTKQGQLVRPVSKICLLT